MTIILSILLTISLNSREIIFNIANNQFIELNLMNSMSDKKLQKDIYTYCKEIGVRYTDVLVIGYRESRYRANSLHYNEAKVRNGQFISPTCDVGVMQINIPAEQLSEKEYLYNAKTNIRSGTKMIKSIQDRYDAKTLKEIMIAYNMGYWRLYEYRDGELELSESWQKAKEEAESYVEKQIKKAVIEKLKVLLQIKNEKQYR